MSQFIKNMSEFNFSLNRPKIEAVLGGWPQGVGLAGVFLGRGPVENRVLTVFM